MTSSPLALLPPQVLHSLVQEALPGASKVASTRQALLNEVRAKQGTAVSWAKDQLARVMRQSPDEARASVTAEWLARFNITLLDLLSRPTAPFSFRELCDARLITTADHARALGVTSWAALSALAVAPDPVSPRRLLRALELPRGALGRALGVTMEGRKAERAWLIHAARFTPRDLAALGVPLGTWFDERPELLAEASQSAVDWLALGTAEEWRKYAGLTPAHLQVLLGQSRPAAVVTAATMTTDALLL